MLVQVYGYSAMKKTAVYRGGVQRFSERRGSVTDEERSGRPATSWNEENIATFRQTVRENRRLTVRSIAEQVNIDRETGKSKLRFLTWGRCVQKLSQRSSTKNENIEEFLATKQITVLEHPAYSPDLAPVTFFCSRR